MPRPRIILLAVGRNFHVNAALSTYFRYLPLLVASAGLSRSFYLARVRRISCNKCRGMLFIRSNVSGSMELAATLVAQLIYSSGSVSAGCVGINIFG